MSKPVYAIGAGALLLYAFSGGGGTNQKEREAEAFSKWKVTEHQVAIYRDCRTSLSRHDKKYKESINPTSGCACTAGRIGQLVRPDQYQHASNVHDIIVEFSTRKDRRSSIGESLQNDDSLKGLSSSDRFKLFSVVSKAIGFCGSVENHLDNPELRKKVIEAKRQGKYAN